jgi:FkbM family methyltransferase
MSDNLTRNLHWRDADSPLPDPSRSVYFIGYPSHLFKSYAPLILHTIEDRVAGVVSDQYAAQFGCMSLWGRKLPVVDVDAIRRAAARGPVEVIHFFENRDQFWALGTLQGIAGVTVVDFLARLDSLGLLHTYVPVAEERRWWSAQSEASIAAVAARFGDELSRRTLRARIAAITSGDRRPLLEVMLPAHLEYYNRGAMAASLVPRDDEIFVDVGAAHGDTVARFVETVQGRFKAVHAFEPTPGQFEALAAYTAGDARMHAHRNAVGEAPGKLTFYDHPRNPFAGNALTQDVAAVAIEVDCVRLDDVLASCSLVKLDVEGFETRVLRGARRLVGECRPDMAITCYHYPQDLFEILAEVDAIHRYRHIALRHFGPSLHDTVMLFSDRQAFA